MRNARGIIAGMGLGTFLLAWCLALFPLSVQAANDYEYGRGLMKMDSPRFRTADLVEHLIKRLSTNANQKSQLEGLLVEASLRRQQSRRASAEKRKELLGCEHLSENAVEVLARHITRFSLGGIRAVRESISAEPAKVNS